MNDVRSRLEGQLGHKVPEPVWERLVEQRYVAEVEAERDEGAFEALVAEARALLRLATAVAGRRSPPGRRKGDLALKLTPYELARVGTTATYLAAEAARLPRVIAFRSDVLGGRTLTPRAARSFVASPAVRLLPRAVFLRWRIPFVGHHAELLLDQGQESKTRGSGRATRTATLRVNGRTLTRRYVWYQYVRTPRGAIPVVQSRFVLFDEEMRADTRLRVAPESVFDEVVDLGIWLGARFTWDPFDAMWFVLTGRVPPPISLAAFLLPPEDPFAPIVLPARPEPHEAVAGTLTLRVAPWISARSVLRAYRVYQARMHSTDGDISKPRAGLDNRRVSPKAFALAGFITAQVGVPRRSWAERMRLWNREQPKYRYDDRRTFRRDWMRSREALLAPPPFLR